MGSIRTEDHVQENLSARHTQLRARRNNACPKHGTRMPRPLPAATRRHSTVVYLARCGLEIANTNLTGFDESPAASRAVSVPM